LNNKERREFELEEAAKKELLPYKLPKNATRSIYKGLLEMIEESPDDEELQGIVDEFFEIVVFEDDMTFVVYEMPLYGGYDSSYIQVGLGMKNVVSYPVYMFSKETLRMKLIE
jgi:hypothetical protein